jgi:hypothetical protein
MAVLARKRANGASGKLVGKLVDAVQRGMEYPCADGRLFGTPAFATDFPGPPQIFWLSSERISRALDTSKDFCQLRNCIKRGLTPSPTCLPGQGGSRKGMRPVGNEAGRTRRQPSSGSRWRAFCFLGPSHTATDYVVRIDGRDVVIKPNERSAAVDKALSHFKARGAAFITAFKPYSRRCGKQVNLAAHAQLLAAVRRRRRRFVEG